MEENIKSFATSIIFLLVASVSLLFFIFSYPNLNGINSILINDSNLNSTTAQEIANSLGGYQSNATIELVNVSSKSDPLLSSQGIQLVSSVSNTRSLTSRLTGTFDLLVTSVSNSLGLSSGIFKLLMGAIISIFLFAIIYYSYKWIRSGI